MKIYSIIYEGHEIEFRNTFWGKEIVSVDGQYVSEKFSLGGSKHLFKLDTHSGTENLVAEFRMGVFTPVVDLRSDGKPILVMPRYSFWKMFTYGVIFVVLIKVLEELLNTDIL